MNCLPDQSSSLIPRPFRIERKLALPCLNTQITLQYKHHKRATQLIVTILTDTNACKNNISNNNKEEGRITPRLGGNFLLILYFGFTVFGFFGYFLCVLFFLGTLLRFVWFPVYLQVSLVTYHSGNDGTANPRTLPGSQIFDLNWVKKLFTGIRKASAFRTTLPPRLLGDLF